jgi:hypothetical protein
MPSQVKRVSWEDLMPERLHRRVVLPLGPQNIKASSKHISVDSTFHIVGIFSLTKLEATQMKAGGTRPTATIQFITLRKMGGLATMFIIEEILSFGI